MGICLEGGPALAPEDYSILCLWAFSISVSASTFCIGRRSSALIHPSHGCSRTVSLGAGRLLLASCTAYHFRMSQRKMSFLAVLSVLGGDIFSWLFRHFMVHELGRSNHRQSGDAREALLSKDRSHRIMACWSTDTIARSQHKVVLSHPLSFRL